ncbi:MAG TPA: sigma 54-interacting transcriptional regulator, partial [Planctomycetota bacterium]|nr:sigma 54-interacting transcriptional regulator [Planctomycetota bacterium]
GAPKEMPATVEASEVLGSSSCAKLLREQVKRLAATDSVAMLFQGEEGTGRSFLARSVHRHGPRRNLPLRAVDCSSLSRSLLETEIFGRSASSGSGLAELGQGSVLLIQNVEELPLPLQGRLLSALRAASLSAHGGPHLLATASLALTAAVVEGRFRKDLFFALSGLSVVLPPLRERGEDILLLARAFIEALAESLCRPTLRLSPEAESRLLNHTWPRNIQELKSACEYAVVASEGEHIEAADLFLGWPAPHEVNAATEEGVRILANDWSLRSMERALIDRVLERCQHNITQAARDLGINRSTLYNKMKEYHLGRLQGDMKEGA